ncbi:MAG: neutral/alkaline non-lysosomal ceramidase N-terminal domain-containing protein [Candidatus Latescibacterota bacterium]
MSAALPPAAVCQAGCAQEAITPPLGVLLAGYFHERVAARLRDDLFARAVVVGEGEERLALVSCDLIGIDREVAEGARERIQAQAGILPERVLICATHTHTGPELRPERAVPRALQWARALPERIAAAVVRAAATPFAATLRAGRIQVEGYSFNRLFRQRDGSEVFGRRPEEVGPAGPIDPELQTLSLVDTEGRLRCLLVNFALHPDVIGGASADFISADWPGELARNLAAVYGPEVVTLFLQGTAGDINHVVHDPTHLPRGGEAKAVQLGRALGGAAICASERAEPMAAVPLAARWHTLEVPYYTRDASFLAELAELERKPDPTPFERYVVQQGRAWPHDGQLAQVPRQVLRLGDVGVVGLPAEIFVRIGLEIKHYSPAPHTFVVELANASVSTYVPTTDQAERGAYGARPILSRWLCADAGRRLADAAQTMLWEVWGAR